MAILSASGLAKFFGAQDLFSDLSFEINHGDKVALIGPNGVGKTTLLRILCGLDTPSDGVVNKSGSLRIGYLPQRSAFTSDHPLFQEMLTVFEDLVAQRERLRAMERAIQSSGDDAELLERYGAACVRFEVAGGYEFEHRIERVLSGLGLGPETYEQPVEILSGGQKTRAQLAKLLLEEPTLLVLDEPTNHLDLDATEWLEKRLASWPGSLLIVAHDRYFLDKVVNRVLELTAAGLEPFRGNYTQYTVQREERQARRWKEYHEQQELIAKTEDFVRRFKAGQRSKEARGRLKRLERMERIERPLERKRLHLPLQAGHRSGNEVLIIERVTVGYPGEDGAEPNALFTASDLMLRRLQRVAFMGPNGCGKTTFLKTVLGEIEPLEGRTRLGANVRVGYLAQAYEDLDEEKTIIDDIRDEKEMTLSEARNYLGRFLFSGDDVFKPISTLSGGERGRVALAKLTLQGANLLLLDEPTGHLDVVSREVLEDVLADFGGTILFVSHDRYFVDGLATHIWAVEDGVVNAYKGNYTAYAEARDEALQAAAEDEARLRDDHRRETKQASRDTQPTRENWWKRKQRQEQAAELEVEIANLEERLADIERELSEATRSQDSTRIWELGQEHALVENEIRAKMESWALVGDV